MPSSRIPSPARSQGAVTTPRRYKPRGSRSVGSPARSDFSGRLTSVINMDKNSFALSPLPNRRSVLVDNTHIEEPKRRSWWKQLGEHSRDVIEVIENNKVSTETNIVEDLFEMEVLSQEKNSYNPDLPESSDGESIHSIVIPQRKIFKQKENEPQKKFGELVGNRETLPKLLKSNAGHDNTLNVAPKNLFQSNKQRNKLIFPAALLDISLHKTTADKSKENIKEPPKTQVRNIFGNRATTKRKNIFAAFVLSESEEEIPEIQPRVFGFPKKSDQTSRGNTTLRGKREPSPASSVTTDMEMDDWNMLPSSTMVAEQLEETNAATPVKRPRLSKLSEAIETGTGTNSNTTVNKTKQSNKSTSLKNKSKNLSTAKDKSLEMNRSMTTRNSSKMMKNSSQNNLENDAINNSLASQNTSKNKTLRTNASLNKYKLEESQKSVRNNDKNNTLERSKQNISKSNTLNIDGHKQKTQDHIVVNIIEHNKNSDENEENVDNYENNFNLEYESDEQKEVNTQKEVNNSIKNKNVTSKRDSTAHQSNVYPTEDISFKKLKVIDKKTVEETEESEILKESEMDSSEIKDDQTKTYDHNNSKRDLNRKQDVNNDHKQVKDVNNEIVEELMDVDEIDKGNSNVMDKQTEDDNAVQINQQKQVENLGDEKVRLEKQDAIQVVDENDGLAQNECDQVIENVNGASEQLEKEIESESEKHNEIEADDQNEKEVEEQKENEENDLNEYETEEQNESIEEQNESQEDLQVESYEHTQNESQVEERQKIEDEEQNESEDEVQNESDDEVQNESEEEVQNESEEEVQNESDDEVQNESEEEVQNESDDEVQNESEEVQNESEKEVQNESEEVQNESEEEVQNESEDEHYLNQEDDQNEDDGEEKNQNSVKEATEIREESEDFIEKTVTPNSSGIKSPEAILHDKTNQADSFTVRGRNTSGRRSKSMITPLNIRPRPQPRESAAVSEGGGDSSAEGSGWDSHRTTRKTLRQTFGKDFTPRKSLRAMVMEKSAKRQTAYMDARSEITTLPQANSTEYPDMSNRDYEDDESYQPSDHEMSRRTRQAKLEMCLEEIRKKNEERRQRTKLEVENLFKRSVKENNMFKVPARPMFTWRGGTKPTQKKSKPKQMNSIMPLDYLPPEMLEDMKYKPPKRFKPSNASWITKRLYKFLETKLEPRYDYKARVRAEKLVETIYNFTKVVRRHDLAPTDAVQVLKHEMARLDIVKTHFEFYEFFTNYMPREIRVKVIPDIVNKIPLPKKGIFSEIQL